MIAIPQNIQLHVLKCHVYRIVLILIVKQSLQSQKQQTQVLAVPDDVCYQTTRNNVLVASLIRIGTASN